MQNDGLMRVRRRDGESSTRLALLLADVRLSSH